MCVCVCVCVCVGGGQPMSSLCFIMIYIYISKTLPKLNSGLYLSNSLQTDSPNNLITNALVDDGQQLFFKMCGIKNLYIHAGTWKRGSNDQIDTPIMLNPHIFCLI